MRLIDWVYNSVFRLLKFEQLFWCDIELVIENLLFSIVVFVWLIEAGNIYIYIYIIASMCCAVPVVGNFKTNGKIMPVATYLSASLTRWIHATCSKKWLPDLLIAILSSYTDSVRAFRKKKICKICIRRHKWEQTNIHILACALPLPSHPNYYAIRPSHEWISGSQLRKTIVCDTHMTQHNGSSIHASTDWGNTTLATKTII